MAEPSIEDLARQVQALREQVKGLVGPSQLDNSSVSYAPGASFDLGDVAFAAADVETAIPGLTDLLASNEDALAAAREDVAAAIDAAQEASDAGVAAGELASAAADDALAKAQEALDAAAAAGGGATYSGTAPTAETPGVDGQQWFVWDSAYKITAYYVYDAATTQWVRTEITDAVLGNIDAGSITSGYIGADRIAAASLTAAVLAADTLTSREIGADAILARNIKAAEITGDKIAARTIAAGNIQAGTITGNEIKANSITATQIQANSITANEINLSTLNGKTITGVQINGATINTVNTSGAYVSVKGAGTTYYDSSGGYPHYSDLGLFPDGSLRIFGNIAVNAAGTEYWNYTTKFGGFRTGLLSFVSSTERLGLSTSLAIEALRVYTGTVTANDYLTPDGTSILPAAGTPTNVQSGWTVAATKMWTHAGYAYIQFVANKSSTIAAGASEVVCTVPAAFRPAAGQYLTSGVAYGSTPPVATPLQISGTGVITVFNTTSAHNSFSGVFAHPV